MNNNMKINQILKKLEDIDKKIEKPLTVDDYVSERDAKKNASKRYYLVLGKEKSRTSFF